MSLGSVAFDCPVALGRVKTSSATLRRCAGWMKVFRVG
jgi:hypothetical protein